MMHSFSYNIFKGHDRANICIENEVQTYLDCRYLTPQEAAWRLFKYEMQHQSHTVNRMEIHLPYEQRVYFKKGEEEVARDKKRPENSMLCQYFELNKKDNEARNLLYTEVGKHYIFSKGEFKKRKVQILQF